MKKPDFGYDGPPVSRSDLRRRIIQLRSILQASDAKRGDRDLVPSFLKFLRVLEANLIAIEPDVAHGLIAPVEAGAWAVKNAHSIRP